MSTSVAILWVNMVRIATCMWVSGVQVREVAVALLVTTQCGNLGRQLTIETLIYCMGTVTAYCQS